ncbi:hypothetical protein FC86_GL000529 [Holzapfeliella floricola DSM 23037 = JCM 16512]|uniref:Uncharacterized protein n=2 Tax=Holzapfeliella TaxID=2767883 RepID=A0A0R2DIV3_9LACO|nr:hypothetical protein FC86_GL000529 [Holzapfeliella floricola DSM 23037 = JCM 16512]
MIDLVFIISITLIDVTIFFKEIEKPKQKRSSLLILLAIISFVIVLLYTVSLVLKAF